MGRELQYKRLFQADAMFDQHLFTEWDFLQIENVLYSPREEDLAARAIFSINTSYAPYAKEVGYDFRVRQGAASIYADGATANDIQFVSENGGRVTNIVYDIGTAIRYTRKEQEALQAKRSLGKGPSTDLDTLRIQSARRFIMETESKCAFVGAKGVTGTSTYNVVGALDSSWYDTSSGSSTYGTKGFMTQVAAGAQTSSVSWGGDSGTPKMASEILTDLLQGVKYVERLGLFKARVLVLPPAQFTLLRQPFNSGTTSLQVSYPITLLEWLKSNGMYFEKIVSSRQMLAANNGLASGKDCFMILDNDPEVIQMVLTYDITMGNPVYDIMQTMTMMVSEGFGGVLFRHPAGAYVGYGI